MSDLNCPKCGAGNEICHDDGQGYEEDVRHEQDCSSCGYTFEFTTSVMYYYTAYCSDGHDMESWGDEFKGMYGCKNCDYSELRQEQAND